MVCRNNCTTEHTHVVNLGQIKVNLGWFKVNLGQFKVNLGWFKVNLGQIKVNLGWFKVNLGWFKVNLGQFKVNLFKVVRIILKLIHPRHHQMTGSHSHNIQHSGSRCGHRA